MAEQDGPGTAGPAPAEVAPEAAFRRYGTATYAFFLRRVGNPDRAADLNQELWLRYCRTLPAWRRDCSLATWLFLLARRLLVDERRRAAARLAAVTEDGDEVLARIVAPGIGMEESLDTRRRFRHLRECFQRLDPLSRAVIGGHYVHGLTLRQLTELLGLGNPSGSRALLLRALRRLRRCLLAAADGGTDTPGGAR